MRKPLINWHEYSIKLKFYLKFLHISVMTNFKLSLTSRLTFFTTILITVIKQVIFLIGWYFFFAKYKIVEGWNFNEMLLMYGEVIIAIGIVEVFFFGLREIPRLIESQELDTFILQPKNLILNIALSKGDMSSIGEIFAGIILIYYSGYLISSPGLIVLVASMGILFMFALFLYLGCIAFYMKDSHDFVRELTLNAIIMATQPNAAYSGAIKMLTFTLVPVAFISFFPIEYLRTSKLEYLMLTFIGTLGFFAIAWGLFYRGLRAYESGNRIIFRH